MKNLKRVLSLALTGVMLVGMMAMGASAVNAEDFTDASEIEHTEAVSIATALKIIDGQEDGSFNPNGLVTRGQMAKMITRAMYGGADPVLGVKTTPSFTDIAGRWDESYIEYCYSQGIVSGRGDGTFDPEGNVTGTEAAKMLLTALGYQADIYKMTGADWAVNTNSIANDTKVGLYDGLKGIDPNAAFTRDQVAQMVYNTVNADTKKMTPTTSTNGTIEYQYNDGDTFLYERYGAVRVEGVVTKNEFSDNSDTWSGKTQITVSNDEELDQLLGGTAVSSKGYKLDVATGADEFGRAVIVYLKPSSSNEGNLEKGTIISDVIIDESNTTEIATAGRFSGDDHYLYQWIDKNGLELPNSGYDSYTNYAKDDTAVARTVKNDDVGTEWIAIDNDGDGEVEVVLRNTSSFGKVTKWDEKNEKVTVASGIVPNADMDDVVAYDGIAKDDWVNVTKVDATYYITKAETVEGTLDSMKGTAARDTLVVDGETYTITGKAPTTTDSDVKNVSSLDTGDPLDKDITLYLDAYGYVIAVTSNAAKEYLLVGNASWTDAATSQNSGTLTAYVYFEDGTAGSYTVDSVKGNDPVEDNADVTKASDCIKGKIWKYSMTNNDELELTAVTNTPTSENQTVNYDKGDMTIDGGPSGKYITDDTVVFFVTLKAASNAKIDKVSVYTGKTSPSVKNLGSKAAWLTRDGFQPTLVTVAGTGTSLDVVLFASDTTAGSDWVFLIDSVQKNSTGWTYRAIVDGDVDVIQSNSTTRKTTYKNVAYDYDMDGDTYNLNSTQPDNVTGLVSTIDGNRLVVGGTEYKITSDTVVAFIDGGDSYVDATVEENDYVYVIYNSDNEAEGIFILTAADDTDTSILETSLTDQTGSGSSSKPYIASTSSDSITHTEDLVNKFTTQVGVEKVLIKGSANAPVAGTAKVSEIRANAGKVDINSSTDASADTYYLVIIENGAADTSTDAYSVYQITLS